MFWHSKSPITPSPLIVVVLSLISFLLIRLNFLFLNFWRCASARAVTEKKHIIRGAERRCCRTMCYCDICSRSGVWARCEDNVCCCLSRIKGYVKRLCQDVLSFNVFAFDIQFCVGSIIDIGHCYTVILVTGVLPLG